MPLYSFVRTVPVVVTVEAPDEQTGWTESGHRLDEFMTDAVNNVPRISNAVGSPLYDVEYHGDAVYVSQLQGLRRPFA